MQLPSRLDATTLGDVLGALARELATGTLTLVDARGDEHFISLRRGLVQGVRTPLEAPRLGELLVREGLLPESLRRRLQQALVLTPARPVGEVLIDAGLEPGLIHAALRQQLRERLDALFRLRTAALRFNVLGAPRLERLEVPLSLREYLHGRPRRRGRSASSASPPRAGSAGTAKGAPPPAGGGAALQRAAALEVLGLEGGASPEQIRQAFRRLARDAHPDRQRPTPLVDGRRRSFAELSEAYHRLLL